MESGSTGDPVPKELMVFISDASAEAERLTLALRSQGYVVVDVPLALLAGRVSVQRPALVLCDADADGAVPTLERLRAGSKDAPIPVVLLGNRGGPMEHIDGSLVAAVFARPVNVMELAGTVERLVGAPPGRRRAPGSPLSARPRIATSSRPPGRSGPPSVIPARGARPDAAAPIPLPPDLAGDPTPKESSDAPVVELSAEIQGTLAEAELRLEESRPGPASGRDEPGPEAEVEAALPADVLAALDEPLDEEEAAEGQQSPSTGEGTFALTGTKAGGRANTQSGGTGTSDGTAIPPSEPSLGSMAGRTAMTAADKVAPASDVEGDLGERLARQQASTPKPPKPSPADLLPSTPPEGERGVSMPPVTSIDHPPAASSEASGRAAAVRATADEGAGPASMPAGPGSLTSTTPPLRQRSERPSDAPSARPTDAPSRPAERPSELPPPTRYEPTSPPSSVAEPDALPARGASVEEVLAVPTVLRAGDAVQAIARAIRLRFTGALAFEVDEGIRRIVFREGDFVTAASGVHGESLVAFLASRGDLPAEVARQGHKLPAFGRRAGAALIAQGHLAQDQLWTVLRAHAEWLIGRVCRIERGGAGIEHQLIDRLQDEPAVFGGATGAEVLVEVVRRVVPEGEALERLGGPDAVLADGPARTLLGECALLPAEAEKAQTAVGHTIRDVVESGADASFTSALMALVALGVLATRGTRVRAKEEPPKERDPLDDEALRERILTRKALVDEGDYFAVLGVSRDATGYDIRRAYTTLRKELEPSRALTARTADLADVVTEILEVLEEAYDVLGDQRRRDRYRRAIEAVP